MQQKMIEISCNEQGTQKLVTVEAGRIEARDKKTTAT